MPSVDRSFDEHCLRQSVASVSVFEGRQGAVIDGCVPRQSAGGGARGCAEREQNC